MAGQSPDVEILVHVTAPSRVGDDATHRQLARAYLAFQPNSRPEARVQVAKARVPIGLGDHEEQPATSRALHSVVADSFSEKNFSAPVPEQIILPDSQDLSFQGAIDNRSSPRLRPPPIPCSSQHDDTSASVPGPRAPTLTTPPPWTTPPSQVEDSYPLPGAGIVDVTPTRVLQWYLQQHVPSTSPSPVNSPGRERPAGPSFECINIPSSIPIPDREEHSCHEPKSSNPEHVIPVTPAPLIGLNKRQAPSDHHDQTVDLEVDITHISSSFVSVPSSTPAARVESPPPPTKKSKKDDDCGTQPYTTQLARTSGDAGLIRVSDPSAIAAFGSTLEIVPPSPPVSVDNLDPASLVSAKLDKLARDLSSRYIPMFSRQLEPFERGYWLVDCTSWTEAMRLDTWVFLTNYLQSGLAGWGVWCRRDQTHDWIRLYCWGYIAKHTYLLLYLASGRQIKFSGAKWHDAAKDVVLEVAGVEKRRSAGY